MGLFDKFKSALGGGSKPGATESVKGPSTVLREAGIDPTGLSFDFTPDGRVTISGTIPDEGARSRILDAIGGIPNVSGIEDRMDLPEPAVEVDVFAAVEETAPEPGEEIAEEITLESEPEDLEVAEEAAAEPRTYTVQAGDTLSKIAQQMYGDASKYNAIFEANTPLLEDPDTIFPGQELVIPDLGD